MIKRHQLLSFLSWKRVDDIDKIKKMPRYTQEDICISQKKITIIDSLSFIYQYREIFEKKIYKFKSELNSPLIIDCGANIGLSILFFKEIYPESNIIGFEPDPYVFSILKKNVVNNGWSDVKLINKAVWSDEKILEFIPDGSDGGKISLDNKEQTNSISIQTVCLSDFLDEHIDFLKIDIEGAETAVLQSCKEKLSNIRNIFVEYHSFVHEKQNLHKILEILSMSGFRIYINPINSNNQPFLKRKIIAGMDMQLNIFAIRQS